MRTELEKIELIEKHLLKQLDAEELQQFELEMAKDPSFKKEVGQQKELMDGINKQAFKDVSSKAYKKYNFTKKLWQWGIGGALVILAAIIAMVVINSNKTETISNKTLLPQNTITVSDSLLNENTPLEAQHFIINTAKDTVIETKDGIVMAISANGFSDKNGKMVTGIVDLIIKEALSPTEIISAGLSTTSNGALLETGGMFYINAFSDKREVTINKAIYAQVPTTEIKAGMMLFDGEKNKDGKINWVNPKPLEKWLIPVDIFSLNFYPPNYEKTLVDECYGNKSKIWKDSMYYSFAFQAKCNEAKETSAAAPQSSINLVSDDYSGVDKTYKVRRTEPVFTAQKIVENNFTTSTKTTSIKKEKTPEPVYEEINPIKIKAIWANKFNNTLLATKEFEERLQVIFGTCENDILDLYVDNMNKNLWEIDLMAAKKLSGENKNKFLAFAERKDEKVKMDDEQVKALSKYYRTATKIYEQNIKEAKEKYVRDTEKAKANFKKSSDQHAYKMQQNLTDASLFESIQNSRSTNGFKGYRTAIIQTGWKNIDRYWADLVKNPLRYAKMISNLPQSTIASLPKKVLDKLPKKVAPSSFFINLANKKRFDRVYSYLLSADLFSFQRMNETEAGFSGELIASLSYNLAVVAYKGDSVFFFQQRALPKEGGNTNPKLSAISPSVLTKALNALTQYGTQKDILEELKFAQLKAQEEKRLQEIKEMDELRSKLLKVIYPCGCVNFTTTANNKSYIRNIVAEAIRQRRSSEKVTYDIKYAEAIRIAFTLNGLLINKGKNINISLVTTDPNGKKWPAETSKMTLSGMDQDVILYSAPPDNVFILGRYNSEIYIDGNSAGSHTTTFTPRQ